MSQPGQQFRESRGFHDLDEGAAADILATASIDGQTDKGAWSRILANRDYRKMWIAQFVSGLGDWLIIGILIPLVTALSGGSSFAVAGILIAKIAPSLFLTGIVGVFIDHFDRRKIMIAADVTRLCLVLFLLSTNSLAAIYLVVFLMEAAALFFWPARNSLIPSIVEQSDVSVANGLMYTTQQAAMVVGLAASGAILAGFHSLVNSAIAVAHTLPLVFQPVVSALTPIFVGAKAGYVLDSFTFIFSALMILSVKVSSSNTETGGVKKISLTRVKDDALESWEFVKSHTELRGLLVTIFLAVVGGGAIVPVGLDFISTLSGVIPGADQLAWLAQFSGSRQTFVMTFLAAGMVVGALLVPKIQKRVPVRILFPAAALIFGFGMITFAFTTSYFIACLYAIGAGCCTAALTVGGNNYVAAEVEDSIRGRVFTALESVIRVSLLISMVCLAPISDLMGGAIRRFLAEEGVVSLLGLPVTGPRLTLIFAACIVLAAGVYGYKKMYLDAKKTHA